MSKVVTEEDKETIESWAKRAKKTESVDAFIDNLITEYKHDYGTIVHATFAAMMAGMHRINNSEQGGITGFQASCLGWLLIREFFTLGDSPTRLVKYEEMLYPQCEYKFKKTIDPKTWEYLKAQARQKLEKESEYASPAVLGHWHSISNGVVPFGYTIKDLDQP